MANILDIVYHLKLFRTRNFGNWIRYGPQAQEEPAHFVTWWREEIQFPKFVFEETFNTMDSV